MSQQANLIWAVNQNLSRRVWLRETKDSWDTYSKNGQGWLLVIEDAPQTNEEKEDMREEVSHWQPPSDQNTAKKKRGVNTYHNTLLDSMLIQYRDMHQHLQAHQ